MICDHQASQTHHVRHPQIVAVSEYILKRDFYRQPSPVLSMPPSQSCVTSVWVLRVCAAVVINEI
jgi:hypothetical protein